MTFAYLEFMKNEDMAEEAIRMFESGETLKLQAFLHDKDIKHD